LPRSAATAIQNNFSRGLITEATGLNFPEDAVTDTSNCVFERDGSVRRRLGIDFEVDSVEQDVDRDGVVVNSYYWKAAAGDGDNTLAVVQIGDTLYFYKVGSAALSSDMIDTIDLTGFKPASAPSPETAECQFASGDGYLFVSHPTLESFYVEYDSGADTVTGTQITVKIRDFEGVDDSLEIDERPSVLSSEHEYNLNNQGWFVDDMFLSDNSSDRGNVLDEWEATRSDYPANNDIWWTYLTTTTDGIPPEYFDATASGHEKGNSPAPKGHYILEAVNQDRSAVSGVAGISTVSTGFYRPSTIAFFAGRVWYAGLTGQGFSGNVYFSQIIESERQFGHCYQINDPTDRETFDLLPSDGGLIKIQEAGTIIKLWPIDNNMLVFASNGVWSITGSEGIGFRATDYTVTKLSSVGALTASSFVSVAGYPAWWNEEDIYLATSGQSLGQVNVSPLVDETIRTFYDAIPALNKRYVKGFFNSRSRVVHWVYRSNSFSTLEQAYDFDRVLNFNILTKGFYPWSIDNSNVSVNGVIVVEGQASTTGLVDVTDNSLEVVTNAAMEDVQVNETTTVALSAVTKFISSYDAGATYKLTFSEESNGNYLDWETYDDTGVDYLSYLNSGYSVHGEAQRKTQPTYVYLFNRTNSDQNVIDFKSKWDFATVGDTGRWSSTQRITFPNEAYTYQYRRVKTRGHGVVFQFSVESVTGEPFDLIGWSIFETQNQGV
jgi:hypothetical protein